MDGEEMIRAIGNYLAALQKDKSRIKCGILFYGVHEKYIGPIFM